MTTRSIPNNIPALANVNKDFYLLLSVSERVKVLSTAYNTGKQSRESVCDLFQDLSQISTIQEWNSATSHRLLQAKSERYKTILNLKFYHPGTDTNSNSSWKQRQGLAGRTGRSGTDSQRLTLGNLTSAKVRKGLLQKQDQLSAAWPWARSNIHLLPDSCYPAKALE